MRRKIEFLKGIGYILVLSPRAAEGAHFEP